MTGRASRRRRQCTGGAFLRLAGFLAAAQRRSQPLAPAPMVIQPSSDAIRIPAPGMSEGPITSRSARQNGPYPVAWMAGTEGPAAASARTASPASGHSITGPGPSR